VRIYLVRHADAIPETWEISDESRSLTAAGREVAARLGAHFAADGVELDAVVTSPLVRAVQTAELLTAGAGFKGEVEAVEWLRPGGSPRVVAEELLARGLRVVAVGHEPLMSALGAHLCQRPDFPSFRKGEVVAVEKGREVLRLDPRAPAGG
jgi:phosphohistidine phosphatase